MNELKELPEGWEWVKLGEVGRIETGTTPSKAVSEYYGNDFPFFKPTDLSQGINCLTASDNLSKIGFEKSRKLPKNTVLVTCIGATIGKTGLSRIEGTTSLDGKLNLKMRLGLPPFGIFGIPLTVTGTQDNPKIKVGRKSQDLEETKDTEE